MDGAPMDEQVSLLSEGVRGEGAQGQHMAACIYADQSSTISSASYAIATSVTSTPEVAEAIAPSSHGERGRRCPMSERGQYSFAASTSCAGLHGTFWMDDTLSSSSLLGTSTFALAASSFPAHTLARSTFTSLPTPRRIGTGTIVAITFSTLCFLLGLLLYFAFLSRCRARRVDDASQLAEKGTTSSRPSTRFGGDSSPRTFPHFVLPIYSSHATHRPVPHEHVFLPATTPSVTFSSVIDPMSDIMSSPGGTSVRTFRTLEKPEKSRLGRVSTIDEDSG